MDSSNLFNLKLSSDIPTSESISNFISSYVDETTVTKTNNFDLVVEDSSHNISTYTIPFIKVV